jgi:hypothetical protein
MADYASQLTQIYDKLVGIQKSLSTLALLSRVNTMQGTLQGQFDSITQKLHDLEIKMQNMQLAMGDITAEMRTL